MGDRPADYHGLLTIHRHRIAGGTNPQRVGHPVERSAIRFSATPPPIPAPEQPACLTPGATPPSAKTFSTYWAGATSSTPPPRTISTPPTSSPLQATSSATIPSQRPNSGYSGSSNMAITWGSQSPKSKQR